MDVNRILYFRNKGLTFEEIGALYNISRQRVHQILFKKESDSSIKKAILDFLLKTKQNKFIVLDIDLFLREKKIISSGKSIGSHLKHLKNQGLIIMHNETINRQHFFSIKDKRELKKYYKLLFNWII